MNGRSTQSVALVLTLGLSATAFAAPELALEQPPSAIPLRLAGDDGAVYARVDLPAVLERVSAEGRGLRFAATEVDASVAMAAGRHAVRVALSEATLEITKGAEGALERQATITFEDGRVLTLRLAVTVDVSGIYDATPSVQLVDARVTNSVGFLGLERVTRFAHPLAPTRLVAVVSRGGES